MSFASSCLTFLCLSLIASKSFQVHIGLNEREFRVFCITEDDDSALIWNYNFSSPPIITESFTPRRSRQTDATKCEQCAIRESTETCSARWEKREGWNIVDSRERPMGPVFDYRWEDFANTTVIPKLSVQHVRKISEKLSGTLVFSVRAEPDVRVYLCNDTISNGHCFLIVIGEDIGKTSIGNVVRSTENPTGNHVYPGELGANERERLLEYYEWRTFRIKWIGDETTIQIFKETDDTPFFQANINIKKWHPVSQIYVTSKNPLLVRFHEYKYFLTNKSNSLMTTSKFNSSEPNMCFDLLVGLCPKCKLVIDAMNETGNKAELGTITGDSNTAWNEMLNWKSVRLNMSLNEIGRRSLNLEIKSVIDGNEKVQGEWVIDNFRKCRPIGSMRSSRIYHFYVDNRGKIKCQKLSYHENSVVDLYSTTKIHRDKDRLRHLLQRWISSNESLKINERWSLCDSTGCTCNRGFKGSNCDQVCDGSHYGYNCDGECGSCKGLRNCDKVDGHCSSGCLREMLPFLCKKSLPLPRIELDVTGTSARIFIEVGDDEDAKIKRLYFEISGFGNWRDPKFSAIRTGMTYEAKVTNLEENRDYVVYAIAEIFPDNVIRSSDNHFIISSGAHCYQLVEDYNNVIINLPIGKEGCLNVLGLHDRMITFEKKNEHGIFDPKTKREMKWSRQSSYKTLDNLEPETEYKISVFKSAGEMKDKLIFTRVVRTRKKESKVKNLAASYLSDTKITLKWEPPHESNGIPVDYQVSIKLEKLFGCENYGTPTEEREVVPITVVDTIISIHDLHPYGSYVATVTPRYPTPGNPVKYNFTTNMKYIPTSAVSNLKFDNTNKTLVWEKTSDCKQITGNNEYVRLVIKGLSQWAKHERHRINLTRNQHHAGLNEYQLTPYTLYNVRVHIVRGQEDDYPENLTNFRELNVTTLPTAPGTVREFEYYNAADGDKKSISLRWLPPYPPNGVNELYAVAIDDGKDERYAFEESNDAKLLKPCYVWKDYFCIEDITFPAKKINDYYTVKIRAKNENVKDFGKVTTLKFWPEKDVKTEPAMVEKLDTEILSHNRVKIKWTYPFSKTKITEFDINIGVIETNLREPKLNGTQIGIIYDIKDNRPSYEQILYLESSTKFNIAVISKARNKIASKKYLRPINTPHNFQFINEEKLEYEINDAQIELKIPAIVNTTIGSVVKVIVRGTLSCIENQNSSSIVNNTEIIAASYDPVSKDPMRLTLRINQTTFEGLNCSLHFGETYEIKVVVLDGSYNKTMETLSIILKSSDLSLLWLLLILPLIAICSSLFIWYRKTEGFHFFRDQIHFSRASQTTRRSRNFIALFGRKGSTSTTDLMRSRCAEPVYAELFYSNSRAIAIDHFPKYVEQCAESGSLISQYMTLPRNLTKTCDYGKLPATINKNRDVNQIAYDSSRVVLQKTSEDAYSDYINASYIKGYQNEEAYIATQGPLPNTINDFWRMIWQKKVYVICMLTNVVERKETKCEKYWPKVGLRKTYGRVNVANTGHQVFADYTIRYFKLTCEKYKRKITQLHYTAWPEQGIPIYTQSLVAYLKKLSEIRVGNWPIVVHCSTGDGRTGTMILCDICLRTAEAGNAIDVLGVTNQMYERRANMIGNEEQYLLAHILIIQSLHDSPTQVNCTDDFPIEIEKMRKRLASDITRLDETVWQERVLYSLVMPKCPTPGDFSLERLPELNSVYPDVAYFERSSTINYEVYDHIGTVSVDGGKMRKQFLASQLPSPSTWSNYWRLIARNNVELIIILQRQRPGDTSCCDIVSTESTFSPLPEIVVKVKSKFRGKNYTMKQLLLTDTSENDRRQQSVTVLRCSGWKSGKNGKPPPVGDLVELWQMSENIRRKKGRILVLCCDGITGCGLYLALSFMLEKMTVDRECDVISAVRAVRRFRQEFVGSIDQFEYLYEAAINYYKSFETYSNFG